MIRARHAPVPVVAFTQFADTANFIFNRCVARGGAAVVTGQGARVASGRVATDEVVNGFDHITRTGSRAMPFDFLIATDVLSEGLSLRRAGVLVHLDIPWTLARLDQRVGRLRRLGSPHRSIAVYAIGPPVAARELLTVIRALQRKARVSAPVSGANSLATALPLLGGRLQRAVGTISTPGPAALTEQIRRQLRAWLLGGGGSAAAADEESRALALVARADTYALVAVTGEEVSEDPKKVLWAVMQVSGNAIAKTAGNASVLVAIERWLEEERGRQLASTGSAEHSLMLRRLGDQLRRAQRTERPVVAARIDRCRRLVSASRGIGAEMALRRIAASDAPVDLDALDQLLSVRVPNGALSAPTRLVALLYMGPEGTGGLVANDDLIAGLPHPDRLQFSRAPEVHAGASG
jgi:hypothetical protein